MEQIAWVWNYMKKRRGVFVFGLILSVVTSVLRVIKAIFVLEIIDEVIIPGDTTRLIELLVYLMIIQVALLGLIYLMIIMMEIASTDVMTRIRKDMFKTILWQDFRFLGNFTTGNLMTRMTQDLDRLRHTIAWVSYQIITAIALFIATFTLYLIINWQLALCMVVITPFILYVSHKFIKKIRPRFLLLREKLTSLGTAVTENIDGNRVVRAFAQEEHEKEKFGKHNADFRDISCENAVISAKYQPLLDIAGQILFVILLVVGGFFLIKGWISEGEYVAFSSLTWALSFPMMMLGPLLADLERYTSAGKMIREVVEAPPGISDMSGAIELKKRPSGKIEFRDIKLSINGTSILEDINFIAKAGSTIGILGSTGSGKTSLVNLIARFYEPDYGAVLLDGVDIRRYTLSSLRQQIGFAMQDVFLFSDSVKGNISYGRQEMDDVNIQKHAVRADADNFISAMSDGYDTLVGERGVGISGGQKQRVALARALAMEPAILILDDTTSSVDSETEQYIQNQLKNLDFKCTKIIIAQRISSFREADLILVMDKGRIVERGTHKELLGKNGFYHHIWSLQNNALEVK